MQFVLDTIPGPPTALYMRRELQPASERDAPHILAVKPVLALTV